MGYQIVGSDDPVERFYWRVVESGLIQHVAKLFPGRSIQVVAATSWVLGQLDVENVENVQWVALREAIWDRVYAGFIYEYVAVN